MGNWPHARGGRDLAPLVSLAVVALGLAIAFLSPEAGPAPSEARATSPGASPGGLATLRAGYERPEAVPFPTGNPYSAAKAELGRKLFFDPRLSANGDFACATCHVPALGWEDGLPRAAGHAGQTLERHTPTLWNLAWGEVFFWDGRANSLEDQAAMPIENEREMNRPMAELTAMLDDVPAYREDFATAFPDHPEITAEKVTRAIATYERTLVSPRTRFDRWIEGDDSAMTEQEKHGFQLFNGKANCAACHSGWAFTDYAFHDIGLHNDDPGRGAILDLPAANHAFKTPTLRDIARRAPYMHDGSLATLEAVLAHYEAGIVERPTLSSDLKPIALTTEERADLIAFLHTLTSEGPVDVTPKIAATTEIATTRATSTTVVSQRDKTFSPRHIRLQAGDALRIANDDTRTHNVRIHDPALEFNSGAQEPGEIITVEFDQPGRFYAFCGIHPKMELVVDVVGE